MLDVNLLKLIFAFNTFVIVCVGNLINFLEDRLPTFIVQSFRYGKFAYTGKTTFKLIELPKSYFRHFYVFASVYSLYALYLVFDVYLYNAKLPQQVVWYLDFLAGKSRPTTADPVTVIVGLTLICFHCLRRFYETWFVSVFSRAKINLSHYIIGYVHYWGLITIVLSEAHGFDGRSGSVKPVVSLSQLSIVQIAGIVLFVYAWYQQFRCALILADLRKNNQGKVVSDQHKIPRGGLFEILSSPHLTCEVLIYLALYLIFKQNTAFPYVFFWVLSNQAETAFLNHWWYKKNFKSYPKRKKAFIPYVL